MDRITAPAGLRQRVLEAAEQGARPRRPARRLTLRLAALSACCVLAVAGGRLLWLGGSAPIPNPTARHGRHPRPGCIFSRLGAHPHCGPRALCRRGGPQLLRHTRPKFPRLH
ncbi:MAG: hypothetical protein ACLRWQ_24245 [Flavonifractor plautii]